MTRYTAKMVANDQSDCAWQGLLTCDAAIWGPAVSLNAKLSSRAGAILQHERLVLWVAPGPARQAYFHAPQLIE